MIDKTSSVYERANASANQAFADGASFESVVSNLMGSGFSEVNATEIANDVHAQRRAYAEKFRLLKTVFWIAVVAAMVVVGPMGVYLAGLTMPAIERNLLAWLCVATIVVGGPLAIGGFAVVKLYRRFNSG
jgi:hypothetical protein